MSTRTTTPYTYYPLPPGRFIRTIHLAPASSVHAPLECHVRDLDLDSDTEYPFEAISYTWGKPVFDHRLYVNRQECCFEITESLYGALRCFRLKDRPRVLWADAVCINQKDAREKGSQIPLMEHIYRKAEGVLVWLGSNSRAQRAMRDLNWMSRSSGSELAAADRQRVIVSLETLLQQPWFRRKWIIQEVVRNHDVKMHCGTDSLPWVRLVTVITALGEDTAGASNPQAIDALKQMRNLWKRIVLLERSGPDHTLLENFHAFSHFECADPRDRIFALAALSSDVSMSKEPRYPKNSISLDTEGSVYSARPQPKERVFRIIPDYTKSPEEVYIGFAAEVARNGLFSWLLLRTWRRQPSPDMNLPAWVPDWRSEVPSKPYFLKTILDEYAVSRVWAPGGLPIMADWPKTRLRGTSLRIRDCGVYLGSKLPKAVERPPPEIAAHIRPLWKTQPISFSARSDPLAWSESLVRTIGSVLSNITKRSFESRDINDAVFCILINMLGYDTRDSRRSYTQDGDPVREKMTRNGMPTDASSFSHLNKGCFFICSQGSQRQTFFLGFMPSDLDMNDVLIRPESSVHLGLIGRDRTAKIALVLREQKELRVTQAWTNCPLGSRSNTFKLQGQALVTEMQGNPNPYDDRWMETMVNKYTYDFDLE